jgi:mannose-6-phosphate isomerase-like protein (cupin superfamily)
VVPPGGGEVVGDTLDRTIEILCDHPTVVATRSRFAPHRAGADLHVHRTHTDVFYVLEGELTVRLGLEDRRVVVRPGMLARVPPHVVHGFANDGDADLRFLNFHAPGSGFAAHLRALRDGRPSGFDQYPPGPEEARPATDALIGGPPLTDVQEISIAVRCPTGEPRVNEGHLAGVYVLEGEVTLAEGGRELRAGAGAWMEVPPGVGYAFTDAWAYALEILAPA